MADQQSQSRNSGKKRKYFDRSGKRSQNPRRGPPGVLLTAETGREHKCKVEGLEILEHYASLGKKDDDHEEENASLSLEDELKMLAKKKSSKTLYDFMVYDTGCRGTVFLMCNMPGSQLIPTIKTEYQMQKSKASSASSNDNSNGDDVNVETKKKKVQNDTEGLIKKDASETQNDETIDRNESSNNETESTPSPTSNSEHPWDPIATVQQVISDLEKKNTSAPSSRFVTRMIPIQATCFASIEEIRLTAQELLKKYFPSSAKTFAISSKRRLCNNIKSKEIIDTLARLILDLNPKCKVHLDDPDVTLVVEICKNLCGISVVENHNEFKNFNLVITREKSNDN